MALSKEQGYRINHSERHSKNGEDPIIVTDLKATTNTDDRILVAAANGDIVTMKQQNLYLTDVAFISQLENEANWLQTTFISGFGYQGQRVVSTTTKYFYECVEDFIWVRYAIAMSYFSMYLANTGNDMIVRSYLEDDASWLSGKYVGQQINMTYQGQAHVSDLYKYEAVEDNIWIRIPRQ